MLFRLINNCFGAIRFMTILPVGRKSRFQPEGMVPWFPMAGLLVGVILALFDHLASQFWPASAAALLDVILLVWISGALHLDGLGDTADGLYGNKPREQALAIMKDSRIGAMGVIAILCGLLVKWVGISGIDEYRTLLLILVPSFSRATVIFGVRFFDYGRTEGGTGKAFFSRRVRKPAFLGLLLPAGLSFFMGIGPALRMIFLFGLMALIILGYFKLKIGVMTGDMLGAMIEATEAGLFLFVSASGFINT